MIEPYGVNIWLFLFFWLVYRVYNLRYDIDIIRDYIRRESEPTTLEDETFAERFGNIPISIHILLMIGVIIIGLGLLVSATDAIGIFITVSLLELPHYIYVGLLIVAALSCIEAVHSSYFMLANLYIGAQNPDKNLEVIARYITIHSIDSTPAYVDVCIHFISIGTAVYLISQLI